MRERKTEGPYTWALCLPGIRGFCSDPAVTWELRCRRQAALQGCKDGGGFAGKLARVQRAAAWHSQHVCVQLVHGSSLGVAHAIWKVELPDSTGQGPRRKAWFGSKRYDLTDWGKFLCLVWRATTQSSAQMPRKETLSNIPIRLTCTLLLLFFDSSWFWCMWFRLLSFQYLSSQYYGN